MTNPKILAIRLRNMAEEIDLEAQSDGLSVEEVREIAAKALETVPPTDLLEGSISVRTHIQAVREGDHAYAASVVADALAPYCHF